ncbi:MAG TPA: hypothetical protein VFP21_01140 [Solirubrobacterales bacterium]|nr:hypothetical protein [Solirubrobacterales bacterium]
MHKKIIMACTAIAASAAIAASSASAAHLREGSTTGTTLGAGASITATNVGNVIFTAGELTTTCTSVDMSGTVTKDENGTIAAEIPALNPTLAGTGIGGDCTSPLGSVKWTVDSKLCFHLPANTDAVAITGCGANVTFTLNVTNVITCQYTTEKIAAVITTDKTELPKDAEINISSQPLAREGGSALFCPANGQLDMEVVLTTTSGATLVFTEK